MSKSLTNLKEEVGDVCWYAAEIANAFELDLDECLNLYYVNDEADPQEFAEIVGECVSRLAEQVEHWLFYGKTLDLGTTKMLLGMICKSVRNLSVWAGWTLEEVLEANINKLRVRFPEKFEEELAKEENRDREAEAKAVKSPSSEPTGKRHEKFREEVAFLQEEAVEQNGQETVEKMPKEVWTSEVDAGEGYRILHHLERVVSTDECPKVEDCPERGWRKVYVGGFTAGPRIFRRRCNNEETIEQNGQGWAEPPEEDRQTCHHGEDPAECNDCMNESDFAYDSER